VFVVHVVHVQDVHHVLRLVALAILGLHLPFRIEHGLLLAVFNLALKEAHPLLTMFLTVHRSQGIRMRVPRLGSAAGSCTNWIPFLALTFFANIAITLEASRAPERTPLGRSHGGGEVRW
jgi:hypothetical protein